MAQLKKIIAIENHKKMFVNYVLKDKAYIAMK